ncbi:MAG: HAMP domain-containing sensor histidine kinase [Bacillota bacterium]|nr:HAMP domain-containing sensor histidine kinase [Bacillota bacterium]
MRYFSVKTRIAVWLTLLMVLLALLLLVFMLSISSTVTTRTAMTQLSDTARSNLPLISITDGNLELGEGFLFYQNGVSTLIYSQSESLLAGQIPVGFTAEEPFESGTIRTVPSGDSRYLILDFWVPVSWEQGFWLRSLLEAPEYRQTSHNLLLVALAALPLFMALAAFGSYWIARRAFRPLNSITATASAINEASDLTRRIALPPGRDEFSRLADTFDKLFERLERSFEAEKQFTADASHELRTPVSIIKGACEYAEKYDETPEQRQETISMIHRQATKMSRLISQLLNMTRLEQGTEPARLEDTDLSELIRSVCREQNWGPPSLLLDLPEELHARVDSGLFSRLLLNLVENAFKYGTPQGHVWLSLCRRDGEILLSVRDDGAGISPEQQEKVWQRFYQVDPSRSDEEGGAGLGLSIVRQIARVHGGHMTLESAPGQGSTFTLHLPSGE